MSGEFSAGDVVQLKSGGPQMTVTRVDEADETIGKRASINTQWFAGAKLQYGSFPPENLKLIPAADEE